MPQIRQRLLTAEAHGLRHAIMARKIAQETISQLSAHICTRLNIPENTPLTPNPEVTEVTINVPDLPKKAPPPLKVLDKEGIED